MLLLERQEAAIGLQQVREVPGWVSGLAEVSWKRPTHSYLCSKKLMARRVGRLKQSAVHGGEGNSKVCLLWTPLLSKNKLSLLHIGQCAAPPVLPAWFQLQPHLVISTETLLCSWGAELGVRWEGAQLSIIPGC